MMPQHHLRPGRSTDLPALLQLERAAGELFRGLGMDAVADDDPGSVQELTTYQRDGRLWVAADGADRPVGYLQVEAIDGAAHIEQVSVHPDSARRGIGCELIDVAAGWAGRQGMTALTLTTYAEVPWNAPYYRRLGFEVLPAVEQGPELRAIVAAEAQRGLARWPRVAMLRMVAQPPA